MMVANKMLRRYEGELQKRRQQILETLEHLKEETKDVIGERHGDWLDQASDENQIRVSDQLTEDYRDELTKIERALARISAGTFGRCPACHQPIGIERLDAFPEAEFCSKCQEMREGLGRV